MPVKIRSASACGSAGSSAFGTRAGNGAIRVPVLPSGTAVGEIRWDDPARSGSP
jgi:hypothetical protein